MIAVTLACIVCRTALESANPPEIEDNQPYAGTTFTTHGHYGSTIFDPMSPSEMLEINVCDPCIAAAAADGLVLHTTVTRGPSQTESVPFDPAAH